MINAGDGWHQHPTQALLDALTIRRRLGNDLSGKVVAICGDVLHSRVARSNITLLQTLGAQVRLVAPPTLIPAYAESLGNNVTIHHPYGERCFRRLPFDFAQDRLPPQKWGFGGGKHGVAVLSSPKPPF